ncbi:MULTISPECIES: hypothetical protein [Acetobacter]|uniref:Uncharacterized protein n=1 Tax=Acetobacter thailandicus TaxID=1502842 RepID=A0ABT3QCE3_9PROT|nr:MULTISPECIES: hypothetical protein [Acetobacter]MBS0981176.1 hypothetical protein [Acetobacter thailandicus]MBS0986360.1 hypothetical protein [Acetobacter thailandicus]MCX2562940.1 hypothetical protein [Acetobacter thailandicus]NHN95656.1 hypothetical protein [Acetobacter thailandicus]
MLNKTLFSGVITAGVVFALSSLVIPVQDARSAILSLSQATSCLFQYDAAMPALKADVK